MHKWIIRIFVLDRSELTTTHPTAPRNKSQALCTRPFHGWMAFLLYCNFIYIFSGKKCIYPRSWQIRNMNLLSSSSVPFTIRSVSSIYRRRNVSAHSVLCSPGCYEACPWPAGSRPGCRSCEAQCQRLDVVSVCSIYQIVSFLPKLRTRKICCQCLWLFWWPCFGSTVLIICILFFLHHHIKFCTIFLCWIILVLC